MSAATSNPSRPARIVLLRHGRTAANASGLLQGRLDPPLDDVGLSQADRAATFIRAGTFGEVSAVVSSPLNRAVSTAAALGLPVEIEERFIEVDYGEWDGTPLGEVPVDAWRDWRDDLAFAPPGGESLAAVGERVREACEDLAHRASVDGTIVVVCHVSPIKAAIAWALGVDDSSAWRTRLDTGSICVIDIESGGPLLRGFNIVP